MIARGRWSRDVNSGLINGKISFHTFALLTISCLKKI